MTLDEDQKRLLIAVLEVADLGDVSEKLWYMFHMDNHDLLDRLTALQTELKMSLK